jgi:hypothetical protein
MFLALAILGRSMFVSKAERQWDFVGDLVSSLCFFSGDV